VRSFDDDAVAFFARVDDLNESFTLGGNGFASGDGVCVGVPKKPIGTGPKVVGEPEGDSGDGESDA
jgi:hypothetical protein